MKKRVRTRTKSRLVPRQMWLNSQTFGLIDYGLVLDTEVTFRQTTEDYIEKAKVKTSNLTPPSPFKSETWRSNNIRYAGTWWPAFRGHGFESTVTSTDDSHAPFKNRLTNTEYATMALAKTNPFRSEASIPVMAWELMECATMFNVVFKTALQLGSSLYVNYRFGWLALISDLKTFAGVTQAIEDRMKEFHSLFFDYGGLKRRVHLGGDSTETTQQYAGTFSEATIPGAAVIQTKSKIWASVRWVPTQEGLKNFEKLTSWNNAMRQVFDLEALDAETLWQIVPFSWLVDYFTDISSFLIADGGRAYCKPSEICIMQRDITTVRGGPTGTNPYASLSGGTVNKRHETKERWVIPPDESMTVPMSRFLSDSEASIILALLGALTAHHETLRGRIGK